VSLYLETGEGSEEGMVLVQVLHQHEHKDKDDEIREYHLNKLKYLSEKSLGEIPQLDEPTEEQKEWIRFRLSHSNTWPKVRENKIGDWKNWR
jgi:hypothetical protein